jgi:hypothetical protein
MKEIKVMADYHCHPLWDDSPHTYGDIDPNALPISSKLKGDLYEWAKIFDQTLNLDDPASSGFKSEQEKVAFKARGSELAERLQQELGPDYYVFAKE